jgi:CO dehydrogenase/acetyl-CoA synthase beta subunit
MGDVVMFERGNFDYTFYYEMLIHNLRDQLWAWVEKAELVDKLRLADIDAAIKKCSFQRMKAVKTKGFIGSTGVGQWMMWLDESVAEKLDSLYQEQRDYFLRHPALLHPRTPR